MTGALAFVANWTELPQTVGGGRSGSSGGGTSGATSSTDESEDEEETTDETEAAEEATTDSSTTNNVRIGKGTSSTKVTFTSDVDEVMPTLESVQEHSFPWGWTLLGVGGATVLVYAIALINRKFRERASAKKTQEK